MVLLVEELEKTTMNPTTPDRGTDALGRTFPSRAAIARSGERAPCCDRTKAVLASSQGEPARQSAGKVVQPIVKIKLHGQHKYRVMTPLRTVPP